MCDVPRFISSDSAGVTETPRPAYSLPRLGELLANDQNIHIIDVCVL